MNTIILQFENDLDAKKVFERLSIKDRLEIVTGDYMEVFNLESSNKKDLTIKINKSHKCFTPIRL